MRPKCVRTARLFFSLDRTPFVPVTAILFAVFTFALVLVIQQPRVRGLNLPKVNYPMYMPDANREDALVLSVFSDGRIYWGQDAIAVRNLAAKLRQRVRSSPYTPVFLNVDAHTSYKTLSKVLDAVRAAGVENVGFLAEQRKSPTFFADDSPPFWDLRRLWWSLGWFGLADFTLLALLLVNTGSIVCWRLYSYTTGRHQTRAFIRDALPALHDGKFGEVIGMAARNTCSDVTRISAQCLGAFVSLPSESTDIEALAVAHKAFERGRKLLFARMNIGLNSLATTVSSAPFLGFLGTVFGILGAFREVIGQRWSVLAAIASNIADALLLGAMGLLVALSAAWSLNYLRNRLEVLESEVSNAEVELVTCLRAHPQWRKQSEHLPMAAGILATADATTARTWEVPYDHLRLHLLAMWCCALYLTYVLAGGIMASWWYR